jgi:hypothetical protein
VTTTLWKTRALGLAAVLAVGMLVAACGGSDAKPGTSATVAPTSGGDTTSPTPSPSPSAAATTTTATATTVGSPAGAVDACSLLTVDEVSATIGEAVGDGKLGSHPPDYVCTWKSAIGLGEVSIEVYTEFGGGSKELAVAHYDRADAGSEQVSGLGEKAHWVPSNKTFEVLVANYDLQVIAVDVRAGADLKLETEALAMKALGRLP